MKQLSGLDAAFLYLETPEMPMHVGALNIYELPAGHKGSFVPTLRRHLAERLALAPVLRRRVWWMPLNLANPAWVDAEPDLRHHVIALKLPASAKQGDGMAELEAEVGRLHAQPLDRSRPLWKFVVLEGLAPTPDGRKRVGLYAQFHHAAVDGQAAVALVRVIMDVSPEGRKIEARPSKRSKVFSLGMGQMLRGAIANEALQVAGIIKQLPSTLGTLGSLAKSVAGRALSGSTLLHGRHATSGPSNVTLAPRTVFNRSVGTTRSFAGISLPLPRLKRMGKTHGATLNDMVLVICGTALRRYLAKHGTVPRKSLIAAVPVSLRAAGNTTSDTQASMSLVSLGTHTADLRKRIAHVLAATAAMKETLGTVKNILPTDYPSIGVPWLVEAAAALYGRAKVADRLPQLANVTISNVPGPPVPLYLAGARMVCNFPTSIVVHGIALNITVESYDQQMDFGLVADAHAMPDVRLLADAIQIAFDDLCLLDEPDAELDASANSPGLVQASRDVVGQARQRLMDGLGQVGGVVGGMVGNVVEGAVRGAVNQAVAAVVGSAAGKKKPVRGAKPKATGATKAESTMAAPARSRRLIPLAHSAVPAVKSAAAKRRLPR